MKRLTSLLLVTMAVSCLFSCTQELQIPIEDIDVDFIVRDTINLPSGTDTLDFTIKNGKAPKPDDLIILNGPRGQYYCKITAIGKEAFTIALYENFANGEHKISIQRGLATKRIGTSNITVKIYDDGVHPEGRNTIYGKVSCEGVGIAGVAVSDGIHVTTTDDNGVYQLESQKEYNYVFVSVPSGYHVPVDVVVPQIWKPLTLAARTPERVDFKLTKAKDQTSYQILIMGDLHLANRGITKDKVQFEHFLEDFNTYRKKVESEGTPVYGLTLGDMTWDQYWAQFCFPQYKTTMKPLNNMIIYQTPGNHDHEESTLSDDERIAKYRKELGPSYYSYNIGEVHYVVLDNILCTEKKNNSTEDEDEGSYINELTQTQIDWLKEDLEIIPKTTPIIVSMHATAHKFPRGGGYIDKNGTATTLLDIFKGYKSVNLFTGHSHKVFHVMDENIFEHNAGAVCATWWWSGHYHQGVNISPDGAPGGYTIVTVKGTDISYQYKATKQDISKQFYTFDRNRIDLSADKFIPYASAKNKSLWNEKTENRYDKSVKWAGTNNKNYVYINVWNWDPEWRIEVQEKKKDGSIKTLEPRLIYDYSPLHLAAYTAERAGGDNEKVKFTTVRQCIMHEVKASESDTPLTITVYDRFNNKYEEVMTRPKDFCTTIKNSEDVTITINKEYSAY